MFTSILSYASKPARPSIHRSFRRKGAILVALASALAACKAGNGDLASGGAGGGNTESNGNGTQSGGTFSGGNGGSSGTFAGSGTGQTSGVGGGCAGTSVQAEKIPLDMFIMLDQSGSMDDSVSNGGTKWQAVTSAIDQFVQLPDAAGLGVGIQYFGLPAGGASCNVAFCNVDSDCGNGCGPCFFGICEGFGGSDSCNAADYSGAEVEIAPLPGNANAIIQSIAQHSPSTNTPTSAALQGAVNHATAWQNSHPDHVVVDVFATDGDPSECDTDLNNIDAIAAAGFNGTPSIRTFVIGVGSSLSALNGIAAAGGTGQAFLVDTGGNPTQQFIAALQAIQGTALACAYQIPVPQMGTPDFSSVNVQYTPGGGGSPQIIPHVDNEGQCPANGNAWYYDDPNAPTQIILCQSTCNTISADTMGKIDIVLGCATVPA